MEMHGYSLRKDYLLWTLIIALLGFSVWCPAAIPAYPGYVDWSTIATLVGLLLIVAGLEQSGWFSRLGWRLVNHLGNERRLALLLIGGATLLSMVLTNDVTLFIVVPLTLGLGHVPGLPLRRLVVFEALAVNAGSMLSPIGNPQNIFLWQSSQVHFIEFAWAMLPPTCIALACLLLFTWIAFPSQPMQLRESISEPQMHRSLLALSAVLFIPFLALADLHHPGMGLALVVIAFLSMQRRVLRALDWPLLLVFLLMFVDLHLLGSLSWVRAGLGRLDPHHSVDVFLAGALLSQGMSNVPATLLLSGHGSDWRSLAWGVDVGGAGLVIGSLANLIALRLGRQLGSIRAFHAWSVPFFLLTLALTGVWLAVMGGR